jgi:hypothetical protein
MPVDLSRPRIRITMRALIQKNRVRPRQNRLGNSPAGRGIGVMRMSAEGATDSLTLSPLQGSFSSDTFPRPAAVATLCRRSAAQYGRGLA